MLDQGIFRRNSPRKPANHDNGVGQVSCLKHSSIIMNIYLFFTTIILHLLKLPLFLLFLFLYLNLKNK